jgi:hypothetical protein
MCFLLNPYNVLTQSAPHNNICIIFVDNNNPPTSTKYGL